MKVGDHRLQEYTMAEYVPLFDAVKRVSELGLTAKIEAQHPGVLVITAELTRWNFNSGQPLPVFSLTAFEKGILKDFFDRETDGYLARKAAGGHIQAPYFYVDFNPESYYGKTGDRNAA
jgi:hypothetical protein